MKKLVNDFLKLAWKRKDNEVVNFDDDCKYKLARRFKNRILNSKKRKLWSPGIILTMIWKNAIKSDFIGFLKGSQIKGIIVSDYLKKRHLERFVKGLFS